MILDPITGVQIRIGVMGAASEPADLAVAALNIRSSDIVVVIGGRSGTLGEFAIGGPTKGASSSAC